MDDNDGNTGVTDKGVCGIDNIKEGEEMEEESDALDEEMKSPS